MCSLRNTSMSIGEKNKTPSKSIKNAEQGHIIALSKFK